MNGEPEKAPRPETIVNYADVPRRKSTNDLVGTVYHELKGLANRMMANERPGHTLQATALVHEAYVRLTDQNTPKWDSKAHFYGAAALAMRRILVERARSRNRIKRGGGRARVELTDGALVSEPPDDDLLILDEAMSRLEKYDKRKADVVMLRYFAGLSIEETAAALGVSPATVKNEWTFARAWLHREVARSDDDAPATGA